MPTLVPERLITAADYAALPDNGHPTELIRGKIVNMNVPAPRHGQICGKVDRIVGGYTDTHDLGHMLTNDSGVVTERDTDTVRGADLSFYRYDRLPRGPLPLGYLDVVPNLVFEVRSHFDRWSEIHRKVAEYLKAGVDVVCVLDQQTLTATLYRPDAPPLRLAAEEELAIPDILGDFRVRVGKFFE